MRGDSTRKLLVVVWAVALVGWLALLGAEWFFAGPTACPLNATTSQYGTAGWSWLPPGRTCTWELADGTHTDGPSASRLGMLLLFGLWGGSLVLLRGQRRAS